MTRTGRVRGGRMILSTLLLPAMCVYTGDTAHRIALRSTPQIIHIAVGMLAFLLLALLAYDFTTYARGRWKFGLHTVTCRARHVTPIKTSPGEEAHTRSQLTRADDDASLA